MTKQERDKRYDSRRNAEDATRKLYKTARWLALRGQQLSTHPLCAMCLKDGRTTAANICDHVEPHRGDVTKFWAGPFQSLCKSHHDAAKQREENRGYIVGNDASGRPLDPKHPWNKGAGGVEKSP